MFNELKDIMSGNRMYRNEMISKTTIDFVQKIDDADDKKEVNKIESAWLMACVLTLPQVLNFLNYGYSDILKKNTDKIIRNLDNPFLINKTTSKDSVVHSFKVLSAHYLIGFLMGNGDFLHELGITEQEMEEYFQKIFDFTKEEIEVFERMKLELFEKNVFYPTRLFEEMTGLSVYDEGNLLHSVQLFSALNEWNKFLNEIFVKAVSDTKKRSKIPKNTDCE